MIGDEGFCSREENLKRKAEVLFEDVKKYYKQQIYA